MPARDCQGRRRARDRDKRREGVFFVAVGVCDELKEKDVRMSQMPNRRSAVVAGAIVCALLGLSARATLQQQPQPPLPEIQTLGPQVGSRVPDFTLLDQKGQSRTLASLMGPKGLMLVFFRSADW